jgi:hypothetical protein
MEEALWGRGRKQKRRNDTIESDDSNNDEDELVDPCGEYREL